MAGQENPQRIPASRSPGPIDPTEVFPVTEPDQTLDCRELQCPMPIVRLSMAVRSLTEGDLLWVEATDPAFELDLRAWAEMTGNEILSFEGGAVQRAQVRVA